MLSNDLHIFYKLKFVEVLEFRTRVVAKDEKYFDTILQRKVVYHRQTRRTFLYHMNKMGKKCRKTFEKSKKNILFIIHW